MLFQSIEFVALFLPLAIVAFAIAAQFGFKIRVWLFLLISVVFYSIHSTWYIFLLCTSIAINYFLGQALWRNRNKTLLIFGIAANVLLLGYFKYLNFFIDSFVSITGVEITFAKLALPIAISFFTFEQIAYIVDSHRRTRIQTSLIEYALFVLFYPHLIAGPIIRQQQLALQLRSVNFRVTFNSLAIGLSLFIFGLAKKLLLADYFAGHVDQIFAATEKSAIGASQAWAGALGYTLQIYLDFSAYSDMAIGLGLIFGIQLPVNFLSPYLAKNPADFWRRWHITLSEFLRDYLYLPLGGNRLGTIRTYINLMIVMTIGGFWHGAGLSYIIWGALHGLFLVGHRIATGLSFTLPNPIAVAVTFILTVLAWIPFRSSDSALLNYVGSLANFTSINGPVVPTTLWIAIAVGLLFCWCVPNNARVFGLLPNQPSIWKPNFVWAIFSGSLLFVSIILMLELEPYVFIYFQF